MENKISAVIIEDEKPAARLLHKMITEVRPQWDILLLPGTVEEAVEWFANNPHPDVIFLDIRLMDGNSFMFIDRARPRSLIIFTTAYDEYAVKAFTVNSIDYLLKPIHKERLLDAVLKFENLYKGGLKEYDQQFDLQAVLQQLSSPEKKYRTRFLIAERNKFLTLLVSDIAYFYSEEKITYAVTKSNRTHIIDMSLNKLEEQLNGDDFFRANRQFILSVGSIKKVEPYFQNRIMVHVEPKFKDAILVSREKIAALKMWLNY